MFPVNASSSGSVNIRHFLIMALGGNSFLHTLIDEIYYEREWEYYEDYLKSGFTDDLVMTTFTTKSEEKMKQVTGIVEWCYNRNNFDILYKLIKKGYKFAYQFVQQRTRIDLQEFQLMYGKKKGGANNFTDLELFNNNIIILYLCHIENKHCELRNIAGEIFVNGLQVTYTNCKPKEIIFNSKEKEKVKEELEQLYKEYPIPQKIDEKMNMSRFYEFTIEERTEKIIVENRLGDWQEARDRAFQEPYLKEIGALSGWIKALGVNEMDLMDTVPFKKEDMDIIFMQYLSSKREEQICEEQRDLFIVSCMFLQALSYHYNETKRLYLDESKKKHYIEMKEREETIRQKERELKEKEEQFEREKEGYVERIKKLEEEVRQSQSVIREQQKQQENMIDYSKEVHALRTYIYEQENKCADSVQSLSVEQMAIEIQQHSIAIFGGHPNWRQKIKEILPNTNFVDVDELNKNISFIDRLEAVFINTSVFNHTFYRKLMSRLNKNDTKLFYLDEKSNRDIVITKIYRCCTK